jgi:hypothetical protein
MSAAASATVELYAIADYKPDASFCYNTLSALSMTEIADVKATNGVLELDVLSLAALGAKETVTLVLKASYYEYNENFDSYIPGTGYIVYESNGGKYAKVGGDGAAWNARWLQRNQGFSNLLWCNNGSCTDGTVVTDTNIPQESLIYLAENCTAPLFCDPVSTAKAEKLRPILHKIHTLKPNRLEAELLSGVPIRNKEDVAEAVSVLLQKGVRRVFVSMGADGVYAATADERLWLPNLPGKMVNTTGCGDAFMAALVWAYLEGTDLKNTALAGLAAGSIAMESQETINPAMSATALRTRMPV